MNDDLTQKLHGLWAALGGDGEAPALPADPVDALVVTLEKAPPGGPQRRAIEDEASPYAGVAVGSAPEAHELAMAIQVAELEAFETPWWSGTGFYVDRVPDPEGRHRAYVRDEDALPGSPWLTLPDLGALADWWTRAAQGELEPAPEGMEDDDWELAPSSGAFVLEALLHGSLSSQWEIASMGVFEAKDVALGEMPLPVEPVGRGWQRSLCLHALRAIRRAGRFTLPHDVDPASLASEHQAFLDHLRQLQLAFGGHVPPFIEELVGHQGVIANNAKAWLESFALSAPEPVGEIEDAPLAAPSRELTSFERSLRAAVDAVLSQAEEDGELEVKSRDALLDELVIVAGSARSPKQLLKKLVSTLVDSDEVEEVYASDDELRDKFARAFSR